MCEEKHQGLGRPQEHLTGTWDESPTGNRKAEPKEKVGKPEALGESDQSIVLRDGRADHAAGDCRGEGTDGST